MKHVNKILPDFYIGDAEGARELLEGNSNNFKAFINVARIENYPFPRLFPLDYFKIPIRESPIANNAVAYVAAYYCLDYCLTHRKFKTLLCCTAGRTRSPSVAAIWFAIHENISIVDSFECIKSCRSAAHLKPELIPVFENSISIINRMKTT